MDYTLKIIILLNHYSLSALGIAEHKKDDLQLLFSRGVREPEVVVKKVRFGKP